VNTEERLIRRGEIIVNVFKINIVIALLLSISLFAIIYLPIDLYKPAIRSIYISTREDKEKVNIKDNTGAVINTWETEDINVEWVPLYRINYEFYKSIIISCITILLIIIGFINSLLHLVSVYTTEKLKDYQNTENKEE
jgi:hypothetical protein